MHLKPIYKYDLWHTTFYCKKCLIYQNNKRYMNWSWRTVKSIIWSSAVFNSTEFEWSYTRCRWHKSAFFTKVKMLWDQLDSLDPLPSCSCSGCKCTLTRKLVQSQQNSRLVQFFMKVNNKYSHTKSKILMTQPLPSVSKAYALLLQEEEHKGISNN